MEYFVQLCPPQPKKDPDKREWLQRMITRLIKGPEQLMYKEKLRAGFVQYGGGEIKLGSNSSFQLPYGWLEGILSQAPPKSEWVTMAKGWAKEKSTRDEKIISQ